MAQKARKNGGQSSVTPSKQKKRIKVQLIECKHDQGDDEEKKYGLTKTFQVLFFSGDTFEQLTKVIKASLIKGRLIPGDCNFMEK